MEKKSRRSDLLASIDYLEQVIGFTTKGLAVGEDGKAYQILKGRFFEKGNYDDTIHGEIVPKGMVQKNKNRSELIAGKFPAKLGTPISQEDALKAIQNARQNVLGGGMTESQYKKFRQTLGAQLMIGEV